MKETIELRINNAFIDLIPPHISGISIGPVTKVRVERNRPEYNSIKEIAEKVKAENIESFFYWWGIKRSYSKEELADAILFHLIISNVFEPTGEQCGTLYDEGTACEICGACRKQVSSLVLKRGTIPKKDISKTLGGEIVVSEKFIQVAKMRDLKGLAFIPISFEKGISDYYQLVVCSELELSYRTIVGINPFDLSISSGEEIYKCPEGDTIGLNLLSEPHVLNCPSIKEFDFFASKQKIGVRRGLLQPESIYFCSRAVRKVIEEEKLTGFNFEIANICY